MVSQDLEFVLQPLSMVKRQTYSDPKSHLKKKEPEIFVDTASPSI